MPTTMTEFDPAVMGTHEFRLNPYPAWKQLRDEHPVYFNPAAGMWMITRYEDVLRGFRDHDRLSSTIMESSHNVVFGRSLTAMDGDEHTWKRNIIAPEFVGKKLEGFVHIVEQNAQALIDAFRRDGEVDLVDQFTTRLPVNVIVDMLALPKADHDFFHDCYTKFMLGLGPDAHLRGIAVAANADFHRYIDPFVRKRMTDPGEDLISKLCQAEVDGQRLAESDIKAFVSLLLTAGGETTDKAIASLWWLLLNNPGEFAQVQADPELFDPAFTETMRCEGPVSAEPRIAMCDIEWHGQTIPAGSAVTLSMHSANHDERVFKDPETFDIDRPDLYFGRDLRGGHMEEGRASHVGFGLGKHFCVGYQLARTEAVVGSKLLLAAMGNPRIKEGQNPRMGEGLAMRSVKRLPLEFEPR